MTQLMMRMSRMDAVTFAPSWRFMECDTPEEYELLTREVYPRLAGSVSA